jgi:glycosyltransferase involved in cell wall biosynthesis
MTRGFKILHTESHRQWGGQERRVFNEARWMSANGHQVVIVAPAGSPLYEKAAQQGWPVHALSFNKWAMAREILQLRSILRRVCPDVLNTHGNTDSKVGLVAAWGLAIPCVIRTRHSTPPVGNSWYNRLLYKRLCHVVFTTASCINRQIHRDLGVPEHRLKTFPSGIDCPDDLIERDRARRQLASEIGLAQDQRFIGFVGRITREKGATLLVDAFEGIMDRLPAHHLVFVGDGNQMVDVKQRIRERNLAARVHLLGYRNDPWPYFRALDCFVLASSRFEGVPQTMLQAMFAESAVVGTNVGGIPDIVRHEVTGLLVLPDSPRQLSEAILETIASPEATLRRVAAAHRFVRQHHTLTAMGNGILEVYAQTIYGAASDVIKARR